MTYTIPYGSGVAEFALPDCLDVQTLSPRAVSSGRPAKDIIEDALRNPIGCPPLEEVVQRGQTVNILCDDISRPTPASEIIPSVIERLLAGGVEKKDIRVIIALGSHRYMTKDEMVQKVGADIFNNFRVENSEFKESLVDLGVTDDGCRVFASSNAMSSDIRIGIGNIVPHNIMGWSGGAKILYPGIAGEETVARFHLQAGLADENLFGKEDCLVRKNVERWVDAIGLHFIVNTVLTPDFKIYRAVAGHHIHAHREGVAVAREVWGAKSRRPADIVIVSSHPADQDFWQSAKAFFSAEHALRDDGGVIINVSPNYEGMGPHSEYPLVIGDNRAHETLYQVSKGMPYDGDPLALSIGTLVSKMRNRRRLAVVSDGLTGSDLKLCKLSGGHLRELQGIIDSELARCQDPAVTIITHGGELMVY